VERGWLSAGAVPELARERRLDEDPVRSAVWQLAELQPDEPSRELLGQLAARERPVDEKAIERRWLTLHLLYLAEHPPSDPLPALEEIWCEFGHPAELSKFIHYMPAEDPTLVRRHTVEENLEALHQQWVAWAQDSRASWQVEVREAAA
jgi:hypothetical protein